jgi:hypothetical protein
LNLPGVISVQGEYHAGSQNQSAGQH